MMQRIETSKSSNTPNFIGSWILKDTEMCDEIVNFFEKNFKIYFFFRIKQKN